MDLLVLDRHDRLHQHALAAEPRPDRPRHEVDALEDHRHPLEERSVEDRRGAGSNALHLAQVTGDVAVALDSAGVERLPGLERRVVHGWHEVVREEGPDHVPDRVRGNHPGDADPAGEQRCEGRLSDPGSAAEQHYERSPEPVEALPLEEAPGGVAPLPLAQDLGRELAELGGVDLRSTAVGEARLERPRDVVRALRRDPGGRQRLRHQPLRVREPVPALYDDRVRHLRGGVAARRRDRGRARRDGCGRRPPAHLPARRARRPCRWRRP